MRDEDLKALATGVGWLRIGIGSLAIVAPGLAMRLWLSADGRSDQVKAMGLAWGHGTSCWGWEPSGPCGVTGTRPCG